MAFLHERFPATRTHEVWGSHERVFKQVRTMFANAQRKARLAGGFIQSPGMPPGQVMPLCPPIGRLSP